MQYAADLQEFLVFLAPLFVVAAGVVVATSITLVITATAYRAFTK